MGELTAPQKLSLPTYEKDYIINDFAHIVF